MAEQLDIVEKSKDAFLNLLSQLNDQDFHGFDSFVRSALEEYHSQIHTHDEHDEEDTDMDVEQHDGSFQPFAEYNETNTVHVDGFLFSEEDVDDLCDEGKMSRNYCLDCQSRNVAPLNFISHSASVLQLQFLYQVALANKVKDKVVVDVGSRLGAVLYSGHLFTRARRLIGVEINEWFCQLQRDMIRKYKMDDRIEIMCKDIQQLPDLLSKEADVVIMNNVFQFFSELPTQQEIWKYIRAQTSKKPGLLLVTLPSLQEQLKEAGLSPTKQMKGWVKEIKLDYDGGWFEDINEDELEEIKQVHLYKVV
ncbi:hypothetical protein BCR42DRAFT_329116 [Absidia repens]|uniref:Methyltransferase type 11 domain-containing protein n=1 Tax=Absidia repens TaxID=90262 RepID=A0A1X2IDF3_9FUNG|nr:hypothetical protein BCR42DRAFT_329116 [Absidia repens]